MLDLVFQNLTAVKKHNLKFFEEILNTAVEELKLRGKLELSVNLVGKARIKELNRKYRDKSKTTDVLSFPMLDGSKFQVSSFKFLDLGDIFICLPFAKKQAKSENVSIGYKLAQLTVHGFLHLLGYEHEKSREEAGKMFNLEEKILSKL